MQRPDQNTELLDGVEEKTQKPRMYKVVLLNDDYTTRDFVVEVLVKVFRKDVPTATRIMLDVHRSGRGVVGSYTWDIANTKAQAVHHMARAENFPLRCLVEEA